MTVMCKLTVKTPKWRLLVMRLVVCIIAPFVRSEAMGEKVGNALVGWVANGFRVYANGKHVG